MPTCERTLKRFWAQVDMDHDPGACWLWTGGRGGRYGLFRLGPRKVLAHRFVAGQAAGLTLQPGQVVLHLCDTPLCVRPDHLRVGTQSDNVRDMLAKGRQRPARQTGEQNGRARLTAAQAAEIRGSTGPLAGTAARYGVSVSTVSLIRRGKLWTVIVERPA